MPVPLYAGYVFDLDGTVYLGDTPLPGAVEALARLRAAGRKVVFLSNNPTKTRAQYVAKLAKLGVPATEAEIVNSSFALVRWLLREQPGARCFVVGEQPLKDELAAAGFAIVETAAETEVVVSSFDRGFAYWKLQVAYDAINAGARFVATNPDRFCPVPGGGEPDCAAMTAAIAACTGREVEIVVGKPSPVMVEIVAELVGLPLAHCLMVGDRLSTDIAMGRAAGMGTALPLTGETTPALLAASALKPDYVIHGLLELVEELA